MPHCIHLCKKKPQLINAEMAVDQNIGLYLIIKKYIYICGSVMIKFHGNDT